MVHINTIIPDTLDPLQFAYHPNRSTYIFYTYVGILFIDYSLAFNTIVQTHFKLISKLRTLGLNTTLCNWILDFLTGRPQVVRVGNLSLNVTKTNKLIVDYRKQRTEHIPIHINGAVVELVESFKFLCVHITKELTWSTHTSTVVKKARKRLFSFRRLKIFGMGPQILKVLKLFYSCTITAWWGNYLASDLKALQRVMCMAQYITGAEVPAIQDLYTRKALKTVKDSSQVIDCFLCYRTTRSTNAPSREPTGY
jgi:hypothetical protein